VSKYMNGDDAPDDVVAERVRERYAAFDAIRRRTDNMRYTMCQRDNVEEYDALIGDFERLKTALLADPTFLQRSKHAQRLLRERGGT
jgi:hypothetical protein